MSPGLWRRWAPDQVHRTSQDRVRHKGAAWCNNPRRDTNAAHADPHQPHLNTATNPDTCWLFPGRRADQPAHPAPSASTSGSLAPRLTAYILVGGLRELYMTHEAHHGDTTTEELLPLVDRVLAFARAGLAELV
ncbi:hypothetical protein AB0392_04135 [Nonomuraea angiospora]|uniref:hypothetical protein n=1 Tax=Nonomuraea angiospora TaxID=46172 RepID=UPI00344DEF60